MSIFCVLLERWWCEFDRQIMWNISSFARKNSNVDDMHIIIVRCSTKRTLVKIEIKSICRSQPSWVAMETHHDNHSEAMKISPIKKTLNQEKISINARLQSLMGNSIMKFSFDTLGDWPWREDGQHTIGSLLAGARESPMLKLTIFSLSRAHNCDSSLDLYIIHTLHRYSRLSLSINYLHETDFLPSSCCCLVWRASTTTFCVSRRLRFCLHFFLPLFHHSSSSLLIFLLIRRVLSRLLL